MGNIRREDVLNCPLIFKANNTHDAELIQEVLKAVMDYVKALPDAEEVKAEPKRPATRRKRT